MTAVDSNTKQPITTDNNRIFMCTNSTRSFYKRFKDVFIETCVTVSDDQKHNLTKINNSSLILAQKTSITNRPKTVIRS